MNAEVNTIRSAAEVERTKIARGLRRYADSVERQAATHPKRDLFLHEVESLRDQAALIESGFYALEYGGAS